MQHRRKDTRTHVLGLSDSLRDVSHERRQDVFGSAEYGQVNVLFSDEAGLVCGLLQTIDSRTKGNLIDVTVRRSRQGEKGSAREQTHAFQRAGEQ